MKATRRVLGEPETGVRKTGLAALQHMADVRHILREYVLASSFKTGPFSPALGGTRASLRLVFDGWQGYALHNRASLWPIVRPMMRLQTAATAATVSHIHPNRFIRACAR